MRNVADGASLPRSLLALVLPTALEYSFIATVLFSVRIDPYLADYCALRFYVMNSAWLCLALLHSA